MKRKNHQELRRINGWWWALGSYGGSIIRRGNGYFFKPNSPNPGITVYEKGPFYGLVEALKEAALVKENFWLSHEPAGDIPQ